MSKILIRRTAAGLAAITATLVIAPSPGQAVDTYADYADLAAHETLSVDYRIRMINRHTDIAVVTPHGGGIETGTSELVRAVAGEEQSGADWSEYRFEGIKSSGNSVLHITATNFDEPWCLWLIGRSALAVAIHGTSGSTPVSYIGGLDTLVRDRVVAALIAAGFTAEVAGGGLAGTDPENIANRTITQAGVQIEISTAQRDAFFGTNTAGGRWNTRTAAFQSYISAIRSAIAVDTVTLG